MRNRAAEKKSVSLIEEKIIRDRLRQFMSLEGAQKVSYFLSLPEDIRTGLLDLLRPQDQYAFVLEIQTAIESLLLQLPNERVTQLLYFRYKILVRDITGKDIQQDKFGAWVRNQGKGYEPIVSLRHGLQLILDFYQEMQDRVVLHEFEDSQEVMTQNSVAAFLLSSGGLRQFEVLYRRARAASKRIISSTEKKYSILVTLSAKITCI